MIKRLLIALLVCTIIPLLLMPMVENGLWRFDQHKFEKLDEIIEGRTPHELVFFGSSRAYIHYHPGIFDSLLHLNSFNAGTEGAIHGETDVLLRQYLVHHPPPRAIIVNTDLAMFGFADRIFNPTSYYPFLSEPLIADYLHRKEPFSRAISWLPFLGLTRYDDYMRGSVVKGWLGKTAPYSGFHYKGYIESPVLHFVDTLKGPPVLKQDSLHQAAFAIFSRWNALCREKGIRFIAVFSPYHRSYYKTYPWQSVYRDEIFRRLRISGIQVINMENKSFTDNAALFSDAIHLNRSGARLFSRMLADSLRSGFVF
jgi:hypothetical protein